ncbi:hypothetical protein TEQG_07967 [Trichophyton equinum CBS 127.97]|uniref:Ubiquitin-like-conjugating enzyme ATG10 n=1 Tax=Trichophyton equinum (strain ATCC MYA-4606 / CBS 127.97) TaxID=559882 RepID=F2Q4A5_TRIEC|nr:hypothetical protein TEQG_07967 [Trichophyton equinum CBS 127.97]
MPKTEISRPDMKLSIFPFLTGEEFSQACREFVRLVDGCDGQLESLGWTKTRFDETGAEPVLVVRKYTDSQSTVPTETKPVVGEKNANIEGEEDMEDLEDDPDALVRQPVSTRKCEVEYHVMLSPTYRVPVLYFFLLGGPPSGPNQLHNMYNSLVPTQFRSKLRDVGVMGGVSITVSLYPVKGSSEKTNDKNHPLTGIPVYFVHPCATSEALESVAGDKEQTTETYLLLWIGLVGNCVGLNIPLELVAQAGNS